MYIRVPNLWFSLLCSETHAPVNPSKLRLHFTGLPLEVVMDPRDDLVGELLVHAVRLVGELVVSALDGSS